MTITTNVPPVDIAGGRPDRRRPPRGLWVLLAAVLIVGTVVAAVRIVRPSMRPDVAHLPTGGGQLDPHFGQEGTRTFAIGPGNSIAYRAQAQPDGKVVTTGMSYDGVNFNTLVVRILPNGDPDPAFGSGGIVTTKVGTKDSSGRALAIDKLGRVLVAGQAQVGQRTAFSVVRYTPAGQLDDAWGDGGVVLTSFGENGNAIAYGIAVTRDNRVVVIGESESAVTTESGLRNDFALAQYDDSGRLDRRFGNGGLVTSPIGTDNDSARAISIDSKGRIVTAGISIAGRQNAFAVARYDRTGRIDKSFGDGGVIVTKAGAEESDAFGVAVYPDDSVVVAGYATAEKDKDFALVRYDSRGRLDPEFGSGGIVTTPVTTEDDVLFDVAIDPAGRIVAAGFSTKDAKNEFAVARYSREGVLDRSFGTAGTTVVKLGDGDVVRGIAFAHGGGIVAVGRAGAGKQVLVGVARFTAQS